MHPELRAAAQRDTRTLAVVDLHGDEPAAVQEPPRAAAAHLDRILLLGLAELEARSGEVQERRTQAHTVRHVEHHAEVRAETGGVELRDRLAYDLHVRAERELPAEVLRRGENERHLPFAEGALRLVEIVRGLEVPGTEREDRETEARQPLGRHREADALELRALEHLAHLE